VGETTQKDDLLLRQFQKPTGERNERELNQRELGLADRLGPVLVPDDHDVLLVVPLGRARVARGLVLVVVLLVGGGGVVGRGVVGGARGQRRRHQQARQQQRERELARHLVL